MEPFALFTVPKTWATKPSGGEVAIFPQFKSGTYHATALVLSESEDEAFIEIPPLPNRGERSYFSLALLREDGSAEIVCKDQPVQLAPSDVRDGEWPALVQEVDAILDETGKLAEALDLTAIPQELAADINAQLADTSTDYFFASPDKRFALDVIATVLKRETAGLEFGGYGQQAEHISALRKVVETKVSKRGQLQPAGRPIFTLASAPADTQFSSGFQLAQSSPNSPPESAAGWATTMCPINGMELDMLAYRAVRGQIHSDPTVNNTFTNAQLAMMTAFGLGGTALGGPTAGTEAATAVGNAFTAYSISSDFAAGMFPSQFVSIKPQLSNYPIFEDSVLDPDIEIDRILLTTKTKGWDMLKAGLDVGLAAFGSLGGKTPLQAAKGKFVPAQATASKSGFVHVAGDTVDAALGAVDGMAINKAYGATFGKQTKTHFPPVTCVTDVTDEPYSTVELFSGNSFRQKFPGNMKVLTGYAAGRQGLRVLPGETEGIIALQGMPQPFPADEIETPETNVQMLGPDRLKPGAYAEYELFIGNSDPTANTSAEAWHEADFSMSGAMTDDGQYSVFAPEGTCEARFFEINARLKGDFLEGSNAPERVYTKYVIVEKDETNPECNPEDEPEPRIANLVFDGERPGTLLEASNDEQVWCVFHNQKLSLRGQTGLAVAESCERRPEGSASISQTADGFTLNWHGNASIDFARSKKRYSDIKDGLFTYAQTPERPAPPMDLFRWASDAEAILKSDPIIYERSSDYSYLPMLAQYAIKLGDVYYFADTFLPEDGLNIFYRVPYCPEECSRRKRAQEAEKFFETLEPDDFDNVFDAPIAGTE